MEESSQENVGTPFDLIKSSGAHVFITECAVEEMLQHAQDGFPLEIGGHLLGKKIMDEQGTEQITYIDRAIKADAISTHTHVTFLPTNAVKVHETCERLGMQVIGYYHSHPGFGVFQSGEDVHNFTLYYPYDHQVAVVVDPTKAHLASAISSDWLGFFGWTSLRKPYLIEDANIVVLAEQLDLGSDPNGGLIVDGIDLPTPRETSEEIPNVSAYEQSTSSQERPAAKSESEPQSTLRDRIVRKFRPQ